MADNIMSAMSSTDAEVRCTIRLTQIEATAECEDCGARATGIDVRDFAVNHVRETGHSMSIRILQVVAPEPSGWRASSK